MFTCLLALHAQRLHAAACVRTHEVVATHPHDVSHFTQGLLIVDGRLFESTGLYGRSAIFEKDLREGTVLRSRHLPDGAFGEGLAQVGDRLVQITWREHTAFIHDLRLEHTQRLPFSGEGWGLTSVKTVTGDQLVASDGSAALRFLRPDTLAEVSRVTVHDGPQPILALNELETVGEEILANVWHSPRVAAIDPASGTVLGWYDFSDLVERFAKPAGWDAREHVLNGLAFDPQSGHLFVTGKQWPALFELRTGGCRAPESEGN